MQIRLLESAEADLREGFIFYESLAHGLGTYFLQSLEADIDQLTVYAGTHLLIAGYHRLLAKHFPFAVYYLIESDSIDVYAVLDCRGDPPGILDRLAGVQRKS